MSNSVLTSKFKKFLNQSVKKAIDAHVKVGFMSGAVYPDSGIPIAAVAFWNEYGNTIEVPEHETKVYHSFNFKTNEYNKGGKFVKKSKANFESTHLVPAHTINIPSRPFFRTMIANKNGEWPNLFAQYLKTNNMDVILSLKELGERIRDDLVESINEWQAPPNAPSTIAKKGFNKPLIETSDMKNSVISQVENGLF